ncbi:MAG: serine hydrolase domain-containing protein [Trebonia sp.]
MTSAPLPESAPSRHGVNADGIAAFIDSTRDIELHSLMILRHGEVIASGWWEPYGPDRPHLLYSLSKSFTSTALGLAAAEGLVDLDATVLSYFPELDADVTDPRSRAMLVRHVASMASGHLADTWPAAPQADPDRPVRGFLRIPPDRDPGTVFAYNQSCTYTLATIVQRVTGQPLIEYLRPRLFDAIGIGTAAWDEFPAGQAIGFTGLHVTTDAIARLGQLYLRKGQWDGRQVIPAEWVAEATRKHIDNAFNASPDWQQGYGFQFWMCRHGYRGDGAYGQFCVVLPEQDAVLAITAGTEDMQGVLDAAWAHLLPAFDTAPAGVAAEEADAALAKRLTRLRLPLPANAGPSNAGPSNAGPSNKVTADWPDAASAPVDLTPDAGAAADLPSVRHVWVEDGKVTLVEDALTLELPLTEGEWQVTEAPVPVAAGGAWTGPGELTVDIVFLETPHRLSLTCSLRNGTFGVRWHTRPLRGVDSVRQLRSPGR